MRILLNMKGCRDLLIEGILSEDFKAYGRPDNALYVLENTGFLVGYRLRRAFVTELMGNPKNHTRKVTLHFICSRSRANSSHYIRVIFSGCNW